jgi:hypothetical protein
VAPVTIAGTSHTRLKRLENTNGITPASTGQRPGYEERPAARDSADSVRGRISRFSLDALVNIAAALGMRVAVRLEAA